MDWGRCVASLKRHLNRWLKGERIDPETGRPHLAHVITNAMFLMVYELRGKGNDNRPRDAFLDATIVPKTAADEAAHPMYTVSMETGPAPVLPVSHRELPVKAPLPELPTIIVDPAGVATIPADPLAVNEVKAPAGVPLVTPIKKD